MNDNHSTGKDMGVITGGSKHVSKKHWLQLVIILVVLVAASLGAWWVMHRNDGYLDITKLDPTKGRILDAHQLAKQPIPTAPLDQADYYAEIAMYLQISKEYTYAEHYYLTAQTIADENHLDGKKARYYVPLADVYSAMGNKAKAKEYTDKENTFLEKNYSKEQLDELRKVEVDEPHDN